MRLKILLSIMDNISSQSIGKRLPYFDVLKLFAIFLVLWGHCIQYFLSSFLWTFCKPLLFTVTVNFLQTQDFKKEQKQKNSFAFHSQVWATRSHSWKKSWGSRCLKKRKKYNPDTIRRRISLLCGTHAVYSGWRNHNTPQKCTGRRSDPHRDAQASWNRINSPSGCRFPESEPGTGQAPLLK